MTHETHECNKLFCANCKQNRQVGHLCYMRPLKDVLPSAGDKVLSHARGAGLKGGLHAEVNYGIFFPFLSPSLSCCPQIGLWAGGCDLGVVNERLPVRKYCRGPALAQWIAEQRHLLYGRGLVRNRHRESKGSPRRRSGLPGQTFGRVVPAT